MVTAERVLILHASCSFNLSSGVSVTNVFIVGSLDTSATNSLAPFVFGTNGGSTFYGINAETYLFLSKNETPALEVQMIVGAPVRFLKCTLSGYHL